MRGWTAQDPQPVLDVLQRRPQHAATSHVIAAVLNDGEVAEPPDRGLPRGARIKPAPRVLIGAHVDMDLRLLAECDGVAMERAVLEELEDQHIEGAVELVTVRRHT